MIEPNNINFPLTDFRGGWQAPVEPWIEKDGRVSIWGERFGSDLTVEYKDEEKELEIKIIVSEGVVVFSLSSLFTVTYDTATEELDGLSIGIGSCLANASHAISNELGQELTDVFLAGGQDIVATLDTDSLGVDLWLMDHGQQVGEVGQGELTEGMPFSLDYWLHDPNTGGPSYEIFVDGDEIDFKVDFDDEVGVKYSIGRFINLTEILSQNKPSLSNVRRLIRSVFLTLDL